MKRGLAVLIVVALAACAGVLGLRRSGPNAFPHRAHVVAGISCTRCHEGVEAGGSGLHLPDDASCVSCHTKPHDPNPCINCHVPAGTIAALAEAKAHLIFDHKQHLTGVAEGNCMRCHTGVAEGDRAMRPAMATCFKCHGDKQSARTCDGCHRDLAEDTVLPASHLAHEGDWVRDHGMRAASSGDLCETCHKQSFCANCHGQTVPALTADRSFSNPFRASAHRAGFAARHSLEARADPGACSTCHQPDRCIACHTAKTVAGELRASPHPPGWVGLSAGDNLHGREARRDPTACASCHGGAGEKLCVQCHAVGGVGGSPHPPGWSSRQPLTAMPCRMCHPTGAR